MDVRPRDSHWPQDLPTVTVFGAGTMGRDIAVATLRFGHPTRLLDADKQTLGKATDHIERRLKNLDRKGLLQADVSAFIDGLFTTTSVPEALEGAGIVIEAVPEDLELKREVFEQLAQAEGDPLLATNTSGLAIGDIAEGNPAAERIVGTHFFNPVQKMPLVEVVPGPDTSQESLNEAIRFCKGLGKEVIVLQKDAPGFVTTRLLNKWLTTCSLAAEDQDPSAIDAGFRELGFPMGPFEVMDLAGLDTVAQVAGHLNEEVPPKLQELVDEGHHGRKTGQGWYSSDGPDREAEPADPWPLLVPALVEAGHVVEDGIATVDDVDRAMRLGASFPGGPFQLIAVEGLDTVLEAAKEAEVDASVLEGIELPEPNRGLLVRTEGDLTFIKFVSGHNGNRIGEDTIEALGSALFDATGPVIITGEGRFVVHPSIDRFDPEVLEPLRKRESLCLMHGPMGEGAMRLARACRRRVARIDSAIGTDRPVPATRAILLDLVDAIAHPLEANRAATAVLSRKVEGLVETQVHDLIEG